jgi:hypothetical protein
MTQGRNGAFGGQRDRRIDGDRQRELAGFAFPLGEGTLTH